MDLGISAYVMLNKVYLLIGIALASIAVFLKAVSMGKKIEQGKQAKAANKQKDNNLKAIIDTEKTYNDKINSDIDDDYLTK